MGAAIAKRLAASGYRVVVTGASVGGRAPRGCGYEACDFGDPDRTELLARRAGRMGLSVLINNAGVNEVAPVEKLSPEVFSRIQQVNLHAPFRLCAAVLPGMRRRRYGRIVNITSIYGVVSRAGRSAYSASKFGLFGLSRALALEAARDNVLVNCVAPGFIDTDLTRRILGSSGMKAAARQVPLGRLASADEIAKVVCFLAGDENSYMTGQNVVADGGVTSA